MSWDFWLNECIMGGSGSSTVVEQLAVVLPVCAWVLSGYSGFLPQSKNMAHILPVGVNEDVNGCLSLDVSPVMNLSFGR